VFLNCSAQTQNWANVAKTSDSSLMFVALKNCRPMRILSGIQLVSFHILCLEVRTAHFAKIKSECASADHAHFET
jgi:hypothetical protein